MATQNLKNSSVVNCFHFSIFEPLETPSANKTNERIAL